jgi:DNA-binding NtrC family response regulator
MDSIVCIDDTEEELQALSFQLAEYYRVITCQRPLTAVSLVLQEQPAAVILDIHMPEKSGYQVLSELQKLPQKPPVLMLSAYNDPIFVVRALRAGAADFLSKPYITPMLLRRVRNLIHRGNMKGGTPPKGQGLSSSGDVENSKGRTEYPLIGSSGSMKRVREEILAYAKSDLPVLIQGESGTGKDLVAREIHRASFRSGGPFEVRNIAATPDGLVASELFGCEAGAYTDAKPHRGIFEQANGGTLFLDEIGDASASIQAALLRVVEDEKVQRLGGNRSYPLNCRLIFATNRNLDELIAQKKFRQDLKYRVETLSIKIPPLRERQDDIAELAAHFLSPPAEISDDALEFLIHYPWPGNVRQLKACIQRAILLSQGSRIERAHIRLP